MLVEWSTRWNQSPCRHTTEYVPLCICMLIIWMIRTLLQLILSDVFAGSFVTGICLTDLEMNGQRCLFAHRVSLC